MGEIRGKHRKLWPEVRETKRQIYYTSKALDEETSAFVVPLLEGKVSGSELIHIFLRLFLGPDDPIAHIVAAMTAGATGTMLTNPLWVIKTRFMVSPLQVL